MIAEIADVFDDTVRDELVARFALDPSRTRRLSSLMSFVFADGNTILKIVHEDHRSELHLLGETDFVGHLARSGVHVARPVRSRNGSAVERAGEFFGYAFEQLHGKPVKMWTPELLGPWGALLARIHAASLQYEPEVVRRPLWHWDELDYFARYLKDAPSVVRERAEELVAWQLAQPRDAGSFGMVHGDPHHWNLIRGDQGLALIDFDDCVYGWFAADLANAIYYGVGAAEGDPIAAFRTLREGLLHGYESVRPGAMRDAANVLPWLLLGSTLHDYVETSRLEKVGVPEQAFRSRAAIERDLRSDRWNDPKLW